jgi:ribose/xylose/arabinose/galactoside ABC-type transport system permease subunit
MAKVRIHLLLRFAGFSDLSFSSNWFNQRVKWLTSMNPGELLFLFALLFIIFLFKMIFFLLFQYPGFAQSASFPSGIRVDYYRFWRYFLAFLRSTGCG